MALRGSLREFQLADIFQLISHDGKTGQLVLSYGQEEGFVIFSQGKIVAAGNADSNLQTFLFNYLILAKRYSEAELNELLILCQGEMRLFSQELTSRNYLTSEELISLLKMSIEDLACSLFLWDDGQYRFDSLESMDEYIIAGVMFPADAITMEAMRRSDEWKRMHRNISDETVFSISPNGSRKKTTSPLGSPLYDPVGYVHSLIDGTSSVGSICEKSVFFTYRMYEIIFGLWMESEIAPSSVKQSPLAKPAAREQTSSWENSIYALSTVIMIIAAIAGISAASFFLQKTVLRNRVDQCLTIKEKYSQDRFDQKRRIALIQFHFEKGFHAPDVTALVKEGLLSQCDISKKD